MLLPLPYIKGGIKHNGLMLDLTSDCKDCNPGNCITANEKIQTCYKGYDYIFISKEITMIGFVTIDVNSHNKNKKMNIAKLKSRVLHSSYIHNIITNFDLTRKNIIDEMEESINREVDKIIKQSIEKKKKSTSKLIEEKEKFSFIHDYRQINTQLIQNANVVMKSVFDNEDIDSIDNSNFKALYYGILMLESKLDSTSVLLNYEKLFLQQTRIPLNFHGITMKISKIYENYAIEKGVRITFKGKIFKSIIADPDALPVIPHTFIDNAIKYAPPNTEVIVIFKEEHDFLNFSVSSYGPKIENDEMKTIFEFSSRGSHAKDITKGSGLGLYLCSIVADLHLNTKIKVNQDNNNYIGFRFMTTFSINIPFESK